MLGADHYGLIGGVEKLRLALYPYQHSHGTESRTWNGKSVQMVSSRLCNPPAGQKFEIFLLLYRGMLHLISLHYCKILLINLS